MSNPQPVVAFGDLFNFELAGKVIIPNLKDKQVPDKRALDSKEELKTKYPQAPPPPILRAAGQL